ncbi:DNA-3-methyladenine glycosylase family protein [Saccharothrix hoggarensis]|uniref:DNA-3-methyladenine glycosylase family protein n=1 Tax=Saccharothrix hoggarensis TaxID=913853 RepID=A0ABW3QZB9_9PSEU
MPRTWSPPFPLDLGAVLGPLRRGPADLAFRAGDGVWLAANTPVGPGTLHVRRAAGVVEADAWGDGAEWLLDGLPALLGAEDDDSAFECHHPLIAEARRRSPGIRLGRTGRVWDSLLPAILEQKVTSTEAFRSYRELCRRFGTPAPGVTGMCVPPTPRAILGVTDWEWHRAGVDGGRRRALIAAAQVAHRLERAAELGGEAGRDLLRKVPGVGVWTAAEVAQRAWGDPDAVSFGDFHLAGLVGWALTGGPLDDDGMADVLSPYVPQRHRAVRYVLASGFRKPRFGPRFAPRDYRAM